MAFQGLGTLVVELVTPNLVRLTGPGFNLFPGQSGFIGLAQIQGTPDITLPSAFTAPQLAVPLRASIRVQVTPMGASDGPFTNLACSVAKTGDSPADFLITLTNTNANETTQDLEIYVESTPEPKATGSGTVNIVVNVNE